MHYVENFFSVRGMIRRKTSTWPLNRVRIRKIGNSPDFTGDRRMKFQLLCIISRQILVF